MNSYNAICALRRHRRVVNNEISQQDGCWTSGSNENLLRKNVLEDGRFSIPIRLLLTQLQRDRLHALCLTQQLDIVDAVTMIVGDYLDTRPDLELPSSTTSVVPTVDNRQVQRQIMRLRAQARTLGSEAPAWLLAYIAELEQEVRNG